MIENYKSNNIFIKLNKELKKSKLYKNISSKVMKSKLYKEISKSKEIKSIGNTLVKDGILQKRTHHKSKKSSNLPSLSSSNFPTSPDNNLFSSVFCNVSTNNGFIQKTNSTFNNLPVYKTETASDENTCLNDCKNDHY